MVLHEVVCRPFADASFLAQVEAGSSLPLLMGDIDAEAYRTPHRYSTAGRKFEIYLDDASGTPMLYIRRFNQ